MNQWYIHELRFTGSKICVKLVSHPTGPI